MHISVTEDGTCCYCSNYRPSLWSTVVRLFVSVLRGLLIWAEFRSNSIKRWERTCDLTDWSWAALAWQPIRTSALHPPLSSAIFSRVNYRFIIKNNQLRDVFFLAACGVREAELFRFHHASQLTMISKQRHLCNQNGNFCIPRNLAYFSRASLTIHCDNLARQL
jgi:hypothetical protein